MGRERIYEVAKRIPAEELDRRIKRLERDRRALKRLYFYRGMSVGEAAELAGVTRATGYLSLKRWNSDGYEGLKPNLEKSRRKS